MQADMLLSSLKLLLSAKSVYACVSLYIVYTTYITLKIIIFIQLQYIEHCFVAPTIPCLPPLASYIAKYL